MSVQGLVNVPVEASAIARVLDRHPDYRVLRRLPPFERRDVPGLRTGVITGVALDVETTGFHPEDDRIIELAMQRFEADAEGRIVSAEPLVAYFEDPGIPITPEITKVTGIRAEDVKGKAIRDGEAGSILAYADFVVSHNASFDRPFVEARLPEARDLAWACSLNDVDWRGLGFEGRTQSQLVAAIGGFYDAHRAGVDVNALLHLLDHTLHDGTTVLSHMLDRARRTTYRLDAARAPRSASEKLKARGWRWSPVRGVWSIEVEGSLKDDEIDWATIQIYAATDVPSVSEIDWRVRHAR